jgi:hypothetical protein
MIFLSLLTFALAYEPVEDIKFSKHIESKDLNFNGNILNYSFYRKEKTTYPDGLVDRGIKSASYASLNKIREIKADITPCRSSERLEIYEVSISQLNDKDRFSLDFFTSENIWGYFDPRTKESKINSIMVTPHSEFENFQILTHEIAHHWYSAYCLEEHTMLSSEEFAKEIQFSLEKINDYK